MCLMSASVHMGLLVRTPVRVVVPTHCQWIHCALHHFMLQKIRLPGGDVATALDLRDGIAGMCHIPEECNGLFSIWIASPSLAVQLDNDMKPLRRMNRWPQMLELYVRACGSNRSNGIALWER